MNRIEKIKPISSAAPIGDGMPRKRRASTASLQDIDDDEFCSEDKYGSGSSRDHIQDSMEGARAPRNAANARERARMRVLSKAFCRLKTTLPWVPADTKLSKLDTLRLAATYIAHLRAVLRDEGESHPETTRSLSLALVSTDFLISFPICALCYFHPKTISETLRFHRIFGM